MPQGSAGSSPVSRTFGGCVSRKGVATCCKETHCGPAGLGDLRKIPPISAGCCVGFRATFSTASAAFRQRSIAPRASFRPGPTRTLRRRSLSHFRPFALSRFPRWPLPFALSRFRGSHTHFLFRVLAFSGVQEKRHARRSLVCGPRRAVLGISRASARYVLSFAKPVDAGRPDRRGKRVAWFGEARRTMPCGTQAAVRATVAGATGGSPTPPLTRCRR